MNTKFIALAAAATLGIVSMQAENKVMRIHYGDGSSETKRVSDVAKITFEDETGGIDLPTERMVDMGLSVKWASYNVGATSPEEYGGFYAYGETEIKTEYTLENYKWYYYDYNDWDCDEWEKYFKLGATITGTNYDVAHVKWGEEWRIPTRAEWNELINNCTWTWVGVNGVTGAMATSKINGNSIFLPAAGNMVDEKHTHDQLGCFYWTSTEYEQADITQECRNYRANIDATNHSADGYDYPEVGFSIRPVYGPKPAVQRQSMAIPAEGQMVDLGLSVKWAPYNLGASADATTGHFICWGETMQKQYAHVYNYEHYDPLTDDYIEIGDRISGTEYDVATAAWGNGWRLPTKEEFQELIDNCTWEKQSNGYRVVGPNGNSIYLLASGFMGYKGAPRSSNEGGYYLCGDADTRLNYQGKKMVSNAVALRFTRLGYALQQPEVGYFSKAGGIAVRPVHE